MIEMLIEIVVYSANNLEISLTAFIDIFMEIVNKFNRLN